MTLNRVACNCQCQTDPLGSCLEYDGCKTSLSLSYSFPASTVTSVWRANDLSENTTASMASYTGSMDIFTSNGCITNACGYQGIKSDKCVEEQRCHTSAGYTVAENSAVACWHGNQFEDITDIPLHPTPQPNPFGDFSAFFNNCSCYIQGSGNGFLWSKIKPAYLRYTQRPDTEYWCQCSPNCGDPDADVFGGDCSDCFTGYSNIWYVGAVSRMTFARVVYKANTGCPDYGFVLPDGLPDNRWYVIIGTQLKTQGVARSRNCQGDWGALTYWVECSTGEGECSNCRINDRTDSWRCDANNGASFLCGGDPTGSCDSGTYSGYELSSIWGLPVELEDCKELVGISNSTSGVELVRQYCPYTGVGSTGNTSDRSVGRGIAPMYVAGGFECSTWSIGESS